jgi:hypothetical protein
LGNGQERDRFVKVALDSGSEIGQRTAWILLGDARCSRLVMLNKGWIPSDARVAQSKDVTDASVVISDGTTPLSSLIGRTSVAGVPLVVWSDVAASEFGPAAVPVVVGANVGTTLVDALLTHPASMPTANDSVKVAWTEPGHSHRGGTSMAFPEPVGMAWADERSPGRFVAYRDDEWAGATTIVEGEQGQRVVGVADNGAHIEALTLAAVGFVAAEGFFAPGIQRPTAALPQILAEARNLELEVAVWRSNS